MSSFTDNLAVTTIAAALGRGDNVDDIMMETTTADSTTSMSMPLSWQDFGIRGDTWNECDWWFPTMPGSLFQLFCLFLFLAFMGCGQNFVASIYMHVLCVLAFITLSIWAGLDLLALDVIVWGIIIAVINGVQIVHNCYTSKKIEEVFDSDMQMIFHARFAPFGISQQMFVELVTCKGCEMLKLSKGQNYSAEGKTPIEKLSILIYGRLKVSSQERFLHSITGKDFIDSPEWESLKGTTSNTKTVYKVTITADTDVRYLTWKRKPLLTLLSKRKRLGKLMNLMIGSDVVKKLTALNDSYYTKRGFHYDIRLPCIMSLGADVLDREKKKREGSSTPASPSGRRPRKLGKKASEHYSKMFARRMSEKIVSMKNRKLAQNDAPVAPTDG